MGALRITVLAWLRGIPEGMKKRGRPVGSLDSVETRDQKARRELARRGRPEGYLDELLEAWALGESSVLLAERYGVSRQAIHKTVLNARRRGDVRAAKREREP